MFVTGTSDFRFSQTQHILVYTIQLKKLSLILPHLKSLCQFEAFWSSFEFITIGQGWNQGTSVDIDNSGMEDDLIQKIGFIWLFVHSNMKIDNKRYSREAQSPKIIFTCLKNKPFSRKIIHFLQSIKRRSGPLTSVERSSLGA